MLAHLHQLSSIFESRSAAAGRVAFFPIICKRQHNEEEKDKTTTTARMKEMAAASTQRNGRTRNDSYRLIASIFVCRWWTHKRTHVLYIFAMNFEKRVCSIFSSRLRVVFMKVKKNLQLMKKSSE